MELRKLPVPVRDALLIERDKRNDVQKKVIADQFARQDGELKKLNKALQDHSAKAPGALWEFRVCGRAAI